MWYTEEEIEIAKSVDLVEVAKALHYTVQKRGRYYTIKEMDSIRIYDRRSWCRWSRRGDNHNGGGSQIDFLRVFVGLEFTEAVAWLLDFAGYRKMPAMSKPRELKNLAPKAEPREKKQFELPAPARNNNYLYSYLINERGISKEVVDKFVDKGLIYESKDYHNIVFKGLDAPLVTFLKENPQITSIRFCLDNDKHGRRATKELTKKYYELGYEVEDYPPPTGYKDYNEWLQEQKHITKQVSGRKSQKVI